MPSAAAFSSSFSALLRVRPPRSRRLLLAAATRAHSGAAGESRARGGLPRFHTPSLPSSKGEVVRVQGDEFWHMTRVLRLGVSDRDPERWTCRLAYREMYCQRMHEMSLKPPIPIGKVLPVVSQSRLAFLASAEAPPLLSVLPKSSSEQSGLLIIGPEGDFTEEEVHALKAAGAVPVGLGPCRLRVETATISLLSALMLWSDAKHQETQECLIVDIGYIIHGLLIDIDYNKDE
ncbi:hypothetical protein PR202_ga13323 [Eleusine coracana subsp. coracana]|uniref:16S rRNA (uracil(1498)-N(3))-methyltransferase n=1 Tax=Eleusine coracana subsp. coracana TaxID=191504 RepID=A0AAV5CEE8_ELECO|nr:hypothetical protein PR202_ga13323 [Eleusine coracana subsp. coracana]